MTTDIAHNSARSQPASRPLFCALTGKPITAEEAFWAPPLITVHQLVSTVVTTLFQAPANLRHVLAAEQPDVPYALEVRPLLAQRRSTEQAKLLFVLLVAAALLLAPLLLLSFR